MIEIRRFYFYFFYKYSTKFENVDPLITTNRQLTL